MSTDIEELHIPAPEIRGAIWALGECDDTEVGIDGPAGTGKTWGILYYIHTLLQMYPGAKFLVSRKYNTDLAGSAMATFQDSILDPNEGVYYYGGSKVKPAGYIYPNGSFMAVNGLDKPTKVKSMDFDGIYINEATECSLEDIEFCRMRLRKGKMPRQQLIMDFNPDAPTHFLNQRMNDGTTTRLLSRHEDNPRYWDINANDWTPEGRRYMGVLDGLSGVRLARYRYGIWAAAEGTVYQDSWDRARNVIPKRDVPREWPRYLVIDFGFSHPFVCLWAAIDPDGRIIIYRQIYMTRRLVEDHAVSIALASKWYHLLPKTHPRYSTRPAPDADPLPREIITDHDIEDYKTLERHLGLHTTLAHKSVSDGIQAVASRFRVAGDGFPRIQIMRNSLYERDEELARAKKPLCLEDEPDTYVWKRGADGAKEEPVKESDHALDCLRYLVAHQDLQPGGVSYVKSFWR